MECRRVSFFLNEYKDRYWHALPKEMAEFWNQKSSQAFQSAQTEGRNVFFDRSDQKIVSIYRRQFGGSMAEKTL